MKREDIEKAAERVRLKVLGLQTHPILEQPYRDMEQAIADEMMEQVNMALEQAAREQESSHFDVGMMKYRIGADIARNIRALKIR